MTMDTFQIETKVKKLIHEFGGSPSCCRRKLGIPAKSSGEESEERADILDALDYLSICVKYNLFDLEATKRENKMLRQMLEERCD